MKRETTNMRHIIATAELIAIAMSPAHAQKLGKGGIGIDETTEVPRCDWSLGTVALVEERSAVGTAEGFPPGLAALVRMAETQNGGSARVDPLPLLKLLVAQSGCFQVVDRGEGFDALQRERQLAAGGAVAGANNQATLRAADYLLSAKVLYSDNDSGGGGGLGSLFPGGLGFKQKVKASQTMLTLVEVKTGIQQAVATGSARKKDLSIIGGRILANAGVRALGGGYTSTDMGNITSLALLDAFRKVTVDARSRIAPPAPPAQSGTQTGSLAAPVSDVRSATSVQRRLLSSRERRESGSEVGRKRSAPPLLTESDTMMMQIDLFAPSGDPEGIETTSIDENNATAGTLGRPLAVPCAFLNRANEPCQMLGKRPLMMNGKQMDCRGRPLIACDPYCFDAIEPTPTGYDDTLWEDSA